MATSIGSDRIVITIELSTVVFYRGEIPRELVLKDYSLPMARPPLKAFSALYGTQGKQDGFVAARAYAAAHELSYTVVDMLVDLEAQNALVMKPEELAQYDFLNFSRVSRALGSQLGEGLAELYEIAERESVIAKELVERPMRAVLARFPSLIDALQDLDSCRHLKVIAFQASNLVSARPVTIGSVPHRHWSAIREATCRLNPNVRIRLDAP